MSFLVVDNNRLDLDHLTAVLMSIRPDVRVFSIPSAEEVIESSSLSFDVAFIETELDEGKMNGLELAARIKSCNKNAHIIFVTRSKKYYAQAFRLHADAYLLKKISREDIIRELNYLALYYPTPLKISGKVYIQTFGGFSVFVDGQIVEFKRNRARELLALLVDRRGAAVTVREACAILFGDRAYNKTANGYYHVLVNSLMRTLNSYGIDNFLVRTKNHLAVNPDSFECDAYSYLRGDPYAARAYKGDYLSCYSWAEFSSNMFSRNVG